MAIKLHWTIDCGNFMYKLLFYICLLVNIRLHVKELFFLWRDHFTFSVYRGMWADGILLSLGRFDWEITIYDMKLKHLQVIWKYIAL